MATGYTHGITKDTTFREFALKCARAFGACVEQRDQSLEVLPRRREVDYERYEKDIALVRLEITVSESRSIEEWQALHESDQKQSRLLHEKYEANRDVERVAYQRMLALVNAWAPPTKEHQALQKFMRGQIEETIKFDCSPREPFKPVPFATWKIWHMESLVRRLKNAKEHLAEAKKSTEFSNVWIDLLYTSLENFDDEDALRAAKASR